MTTAIFLGDSYTGGTGAVDAAHAWCFTTGSRLGWTVSAYGSGLRGWGYIAETPPASAFITYIDLTTAANPDIVVLEGGFHDKPNVASGDLATAAALLLTRLAAVPRVIVVGPIYGSGGSIYPKSYVSTVVPVLSAAAANAGREFIDLTNRWVTGTGYEGNRTGDGNADIFINADMLHPTQAGHDYLGTRIALAIGGRATASRTPVSRTPVSRTPVARSAI